MHQAGFKEEKARWGRHGLVQKTLNKRMIELLE